MAIPYNTIPTISGAKPLRPRLRRRRTAFTNSVRIPRPSAATQAAQKRRGVLSTRSGTRNTGHGCEARFLLKTDTKPCAYIAVLPPLQKSLRTLAWGCSCTARRSNAEAPEPPEPPPSPWINAVSSGRSISGDACTRALASAADASWPVQTSVMAPRPPTARKNMENANSATIRKAIGGHRAQPPALRGRLGWVIPDEAPMAR
mmetsp:Transcript_31900/g.67831  ORF Transcript_31900/g.67831 Transcript_31900/m.67831 type:complete len:203 (-) Transcript_31900:26-634(-)